MTLTTPSLKAPYLALILLVAPSLSVAGQLSNSLGTIQKSLFDMSLKELVGLEITSLSRTEESRDLAPGSVYVFNAETIRKRGYRSLKDLLQVVPGFTVFHRDLQFVAGVRGLNANDNEKISLLINGRESNNVQEPDFLNGPINLQTLDRVEVVVGPSSFFQRANTLAATVNIVTKKIDGIEVSGGTGTDTPYSVNAVMGKRWSEDQFVTGSLSIERKDGFDAWDSRSSWDVLAGKEITGQLDPSYLGVLEGQMGNTWGQLVAYESVQPEVSLHTYPTRLFDDVYRDQMLLMNLKHQVDMNDDLSLDIFFDAGYKKSARGNEHSGAEPGLELEYSQFDYAGELALEYRGLPNHTLYTGIQTAYEDNRDNYYKLSTATKNTLISQGNNTHAVGVYLYDRWQITDRFKTEGGLRYDYNSMLSGSDARNWGGRLAFVHELVGPNSIWITKLIANRAARYPSPIAALNEAWGNGTPAWTPNPNAEKAETLTTFEWQNIFYWKNTRLSANLYHQVLRDFITWNGPHTNVGDFRGNGFELDIQQDISDHLTLWANATLLDSELDKLDTLLGTDDKGQILGSPTHTANGGFDADLTDRLSLSGQLRYFTGQATRDLPSGNYRKIDDQFYVDLSATCKHFFAENVDLGLSVQNLLDNRDHVSVQWGFGQYRPRGITLLMDLRARF